MITSLHVARVSTALLAAMAASLLVAGAVLAHPESEGDHPSGCIVTVEPGTVAVGGQFTVTGNFDRAQIFIVPGADAPPAEDATPDATVGEGETFSVTFTAEEGDIGEHTVWGILPESECGDGDSLVVTAAAPDTAMALPVVDAVSAPMAVIGMLLVLAGLAVRVATRREASPS